MALTPEQEWNYWDSQLTDLRHNQLKTVQSAAAAWSKLFAALLAIFGTVAFAGGLTTIDKLPSPWDVVAKVGTLIAAAAAIAATYMAARASDTLSVSDRPAIDALTLRQAVSDAAHESVHWLSLAKIAGAIAVGIVLAGSGLIVVVGEAGDTPTVPTVVAVVDGHAYCGKLKKLDGALAVRGHELNRSVTAVTPVADCP
jgi:hypothetical protein